MRPESFHGDKPIFKKRKQPPGKDMKKRPQNTSLKYQIRSLERLCRLERLDPKIRALKSDELQELKKQLGETKQKDLEKKYAKRYHHVRFFERVKIERALSKLERKAGMGRDGHSAAPSVEELEKIHQLKEDLEYVLHFPRGEKYVSLLKDAPVDAPEAQAHVIAERQRLRLLVKQQLSESATVTEADEGIKSTGQFISGTKLKPDMKSRPRKEDSLKDAQEDDFFLDAEDTDEDFPSERKPKASDLESLKKSQTKQEPLKSRQILGTMHAARQGRPMKRQLPKAPYGEDDSLENKDDGDPQSGSLDDDLDDEDGEEEEEEEEEQHPLFTSLQQRQQLHGISAAAQSKSKDDDEQVSEKDEAEEDSDEDSDEADERVTGHREDRGRDSRIYEGRQSYGGPSRGHHSSSRGRGVGGLSGRGQGQGRWGRGPSLGDVSGRGGTGGRGFSGGSRKTFTKAEQGGRGGRDGRGGRGGGRDGRGGGWEGRGRGRGSPVAAPERTRADGGRKRRKKS